MRLSPLDAVSIIDWANLLNIKADSVNQLVSQYIKTSLKHLIDSNMLQAPDGFSFIEKMSPFVSNPSMPIEQRMATLEAKKIPLNSAMSRFEELESRRDTSGLSEAESLEYKIHEQRIFADESNNGQ